jgi:hypothetical protein
MNGSTEETRRSVRTLNEDSAIEAKAIRNALKNFFFNQRFQPWDEETTD